MRAGAWDESRALFGFLSLFLGLLVWQLQEEWSLNPHYFFGWGVPILGMLLFRRRWAERPSAEGSALGGILFAGLILLLAGWLPLRVVREANMDWRLVQWLIAGAAVATMLGALYWSGGRRWLRYFALPVLFLLLAVPWPTRVETTIIQASTGVVVRGVVEILRWLGIAAWNAGNVIQLPTIAVGVDEACSGLRSLQGAVMCAIFLGEVMRLTIARRAALLGMGVVVALGLNGVRTLFLTLVAHRSGEAGVTFWHDSSGMLTLGATFALLWVVARWLRRERVIQVEASGVARAIPVPLVIGCAAWLVFVECANALWFRLHERGPASPLWTFTAANGSGLRHEEIPARTQAILRYNKGEAYRRSLPDGTQWWVYALTWDRDGGGSPLARFHSPEVCLPAAGLKIAREGALSYPLEGFPVRSYESEWLGKPVYLFSSFSSGRGGRAASSMDQFDLTVARRLQLALNGERPAEQKVFQVVISGAASREGAERAFVKFARETIRPGK